MSRKIFVIIVIIITFILSLIYFFKKDQTIEIGFVGGLSGKYSNLGHSTLNGLILAFEDIEYTVNGKKIRVDIKDDMQDEKVAKDIINSFIDKKINLIVGNTTSSMTKISLLEIPKNSNIFLFSPTASSGEFSKKDDNFFRVQGALTKEKFNELSNYFLENNVLNMYAIYDEKNSNYVNNYMNNFEKSFLSKGGKPFLKKLKINKDFSLIADEIKSNNSIDGLFIIGNSLDSSRLIQYLKIKDINKTIFVSGWAKGSEFLEDGGKAVNGTIFLDSFDENSKDPSYLKFVNDYKQKFKTEPTIFSAQGYEAGKVIIEILKKDDNLENFKKNLLEIKEFKSLQGFITFDEFGDIHRKQNLTIVKDNKFVKIK
ncbi:ABC transporter substrate-binding protein [Halarcobacter sp.]|uniref:ABC transporter substrate-binding protein n=1 Tax=Halarcobacter sp. TaxID=2321133 RepID=UPI0029F589FE|nr:ABC transporter substrate-binding protein [Halarcobacter sp.]